MAEYVRMPKAHYVAACNSIRAKTGKTDLITSGVMSAEIDGITGGGGGSVEGYATVTFMNGADVLFSRMVLKGDDCPDPYVQGRIELPTKESTAQYDYTFNGWSTADGGSANANVLKNITADKTIYAAYKSVVRSYTVTYYDEDGVTVLHTEQLAYGSMPSYVPTKEGAGFAGWTPDTPVTGDTSYTATWSSVLASGSCGTNATYMLMNNYVLTISGTGQTTSTPWQDTYKTQIQKVVVEEGITYLKNASFSGCTSLKSVTLPSTLTGTGWFAFGNCAALESVYITDLAAWLKCDAQGSPSHGATPQFYLNGEPITGELVVPASVTKIGAWVCRRWNITGVVLHGAVTKIGENAFHGCANLTSVTIPNSVTSIDTYAFGDSGLQSAIFEDTEVWKAGSTTLSSADLADPAKAATYLKTTYDQAAWTKY